MKVVIVEDEYNAYEYLKLLLNGFEDKVDIVQHIESVEQAVNWFTSNSHPDLVFMDIQLSDGKSFEIFNHVQINAPIIFTTAYDQYAIDAFKHNGIDYLLKPIEREELFESIKRFKRHNFSFNTQLTEKINKSFSQNQKKHRCLVKKANHYEYIDVKEIAFVHSEDGITFLHTFDNKRHIYSKSLERLYALLDHEMFFQISRSQILNINAIDKIHPYFNQRLKVDIKANPNKIEIVVNRSKTSQFKDWLDT